MMDFLTHALRVEILINFYMTNNTKLYAQELYNKNIL